MRLVNKRANLVPDNVVGLIIGGMCVAVLIILFIWIFFPKYDVVAETEKSYKQALEGVIKQVNENGYAQFETWMNDDYWLVYFPNNTFKYEFVERVYYNERKLWSPHPDIDTLYNNWIIYDKNYKRILSIYLGKKNSAVTLAQKTDAKNFFNNYLKPAARSANASMFDFYTAKYGIIDSRLKKTGVYNPGKYRVIVNFFKRNNIQNALCICHYSYLDIDSFSSARKILLSNTVGPENVDLECSECISLNNVKISNHILAFSSSKIFPEHFQSTDLYDTNHYWTVSKFYSENIHPDDFKYPVSTGGKFAIRGNVKMTITKNSLDNKYIITF